MGTPMDWYWRL